MNLIRSRTITPSDDPQRIEIRAHALLSDVSESDTGPSPHDYFDASLAACKALTAHGYAKRHAIPLERVETTIARDDANERLGRYHLIVRVTFHGAQLTAEHRATLTRAIAACPIHKLMTTTDVEIEMLTQ